MDFDFEHQLMDFKFLLMIMNFVLWTLVFSSDLNFVFYEAFDDDDHGFDLILDLIILQGVWITWQLPTWISATFSLDFELQHAF